MSYLLRSEGCNISELDKSVASRYTNPMNWTFLAGAVLAVVLVFTSFVTSEGSRALFNVHGVIVVLGGTLIAMLISYPMLQILSTLKGAVSLFLRVRQPAAEEVVAEMSRLARRAQTEGGLLSLQGESRDFADGFLSRAITVAIATGESHATRSILEAEIRQLRIRRQEDANLLRTMGTLSPMFGLLGTLLGMIQVLETISTPAKVGPAMAMALSSAFVGIAFANIVCIPVAGQMRLRAMRETMLLEMILEGILDVAAGQPAALVELHLVGYAEGRAPEAAAPAPAGAEAPV